MGTIGAPPSPPQRSGKGPGSPAGWIVAAALAVTLAALVAFEMGKRSRDGGEVAVPARSPSPARTAAPVQASLSAATPSPVPEPHLEQAMFEVILPAAASREALPTPLEAPTSAPALPETEREKMARCLSFAVEDDEVHAVYMPTKTQVRVFVTNRCDFSFAGSDVWIEARAVPRSGGGVAARLTTRFDGGPLEPRRRAEMVLVLDCPMCYAASHRYEASLLWPPPDRR